MNEAVNMFFSKIFPRVLMKGVTSDAIIPCQHKIFFENDFQTLKLVEKTSVFIRNIVGNYIVGN